MQLTLEFDLDAHYKRNKRNHLAADTRGSERVLPNASSESLSSHGFRSDPRSPRESTINRCRNKTDGGYFTDFELSGLANSEAASGRLNSIDS